MNLIYLFNKIVDKYPNHTAIRYENEQLTYAGLNNSSNTLMKILQSMDIKSGSRIGLYFSDPFLFINSMLAVVKLNAIYVPFDQKDSYQNIADLCQISDVTFFLHDSLNPDPLISKFNPIKIERKNLQNPANVNDYVSVDKLLNPVLYIMFTSSTTGKAKGVLINHSGISRFINDNSIIKILPEDTLLQLSSVSFDASSFEIWVSLLNGATLVLVKPNFDLLNLGSCLCQNNITVLWLTTKLFETLLLMDCKVFKNLKYLIFGGEVCTHSNIITALNNLPDVKLINGYGPTENTIFTTLHLVTKEDEKRAFIPIGFPVNDTQCFILDENLNTIPEGEIGLLYVSGAGLAQSYTDKQLTNRYFIDHPKLDIKIYNTNDLVRYSPKYGFEYIGRKDRQVKLNGYRIELDLIENTINKIENILHSVAVYVPSRFSDELILFYTTKDKQPVKLSFIKDFLHQNLPWYSIPKNIQFLIDFPLNKSNKIDQKKLIENLKIVKEQPDNSITTIESIWKEVLQLDNINSEDNFFNIGGDSLSSIVVISKINRLMNLNLKTSYIIENPILKSFESNLLVNAPIQKEIVVLKEGELECPIFLIPVLGGGSEIYYLFAKNLQTRQAVFGFNMQFDFNYEIGNYYIINAKLILKLAKLFASYIQKSVASKKVILAGYSLGGNIALETISELEKYGIEVAQIHLFDSYKFGNTVLTNIGEMRFNLSYFKKILSYLKVSILNFDIQTFKQLINYIYQPEINAQKIKNIPVYLYRCNIIKNETFKAVDNMSHDWRNTIDKLEIISINTEHNFMLKAGNVEELAIEVDKSIDLLLNELNLTVKKFDILSKPELDDYLAKGWFRLKFGNHMFTNTKAFFENQFYEIIWIRYVLDSDFLNKTINKIQKNKLKRKIQFTYITVDFNYQTEKNILEPLYNKYKAKLNFDAHASVFSVVHSGESAYSIFHSKLIKLYDNDKLIGATIFDVAAISGAGILTFFDPEYSKFGLGIYLRQLTLNFLFSNNFKYHYPGFIFIGHPKMDYKLSVEKSGIEYYDNKFNRWLSWNERSTNLDRRSEGSGSAKTSAVLN